MKKYLRLLLCTGVTAALLTLPALAADNDTLPAKQGDFYVMVNGEYVTFPDAVPQIRENRSCLPFVAVFEQLGFAEEDMTWDGCHRYGHRRQARCVLYRLSGEYQTGRFDRRAHHWLQRHYLLV